MPDRKLILLIIMVLLWRPALPQSSDSPNIVLILADDLGWKDLSFNGSKFYETPNIDRLASQGIFFSNAYSNAPICAPSRAAILSGQYGPRTGFYTNHNSVRGEASWRAVIPTANHHALDLEKITLAEVLKVNGYATFHTGKWHLGDTPDLYPEFQGFDINKGGYNAGKPATYFSPYYNPRLDDGPEGEYLTDRLTTEAIKFMEDHREGPFFAYIAHYAPHTPLQAKDSLVQKYYPKPHDNGQFDPVYAAMIEILDSNVGRIMESLEELGIAENTILVFFSDNGTTPFVAPERPFRGFKGTLYEGGIRVPLIIKRGENAGSSKSSKGKQVNDTPVIGTDLYPTLLDLAGIKTPEAYPLDGRSLCPLMEGKTKEKQVPLFWHFPAYLQGEYGMGSIWRTTPVSAVRLGDFKLLEFLEDGHLELFNLKDDPGELNNLTDADPRRTRKLFDLLQSWRMDHHVPYPLEPNPEYDPATIPTHFKAGDRSDIYKTKIPAEK